MNGLYSLERILEDGGKLQIAPSMEESSLIAGGEELAEEYPDWDLQVKDPDGKIIWRNKKRVPGKAEDHTQNG